MSSADLVQRNGDGVVGVEIDVTGDACCGRGRSGVFFGGVRGGRS